MKQVITKCKKPIKLWLDDIENGALEQAMHLADLPFLYKHVAIMPDSHQGYGMPIGGVIALENVIIPNAVGVDIGCGMCAMQTNLHVGEMTIDILKDILSEIRKAIPVGMKHHKEAQEMPNDLKFLTIPSEGVVAGQIPSAKKQLGTLGGGNHFIEIQMGDDNFIWVMIHSGSRNVGKRVCDHYNKLAKELNEKWATSIPPSWQLAFLPRSCKEGMHYFAEMEWCVQFAKFNRQHMMDTVLEIMKSKLPYFETNYRDVAHNYAAIEEHYGKYVVVHRKGATQAYEGQEGIIPGSQGTKSYIVKGLGNPLSFMSCSHGAGRKMSRSAARDRLDLEEEKKKLEDKGIIHAIRGRKDLDEASGAYKDIDVVMENQKDLVEIVTELTPLAVVKG